MCKDMKIWVVVPAFNEEKNIPIVVRNLLEYKKQSLHDIEVVVVDDGSSDNTYKSVKDLSGLHVIRHIINRGQGAALKTGNMYALRNGADWIIHFDADNQHRIEDFDNFLKHIVQDRYDIILGSRFVVSEDRHGFFHNLISVFLNTEIPPYRRFILSIGLIINTLFTGIVLTDVHNGLRAIRADVLKNMDLKFDRMAHSSEYIMEIKRLKLRYKEIRVKVNYTNVDKKSQGFWDGVHILKDLFISKFLKRY